LDNPDYSYYKHYYGSHYSGETNAAHNGTSLVDAGTAQTGVHRTSDRFDAVASGTGSSEFVDHVMTKLTAAIGVQERVDKISTILRSHSEFRPKMSEDATKELNKNTKDERQQADKGFSESGSGTVSREFLDHLIAVFSERVGPMAYLIVRDKAARLGESLSSFPKKRLKELVNNVSMEIVNDELKEEFRREISKDVRKVIGPLG
jgi:hypothetical protein